jgi:hypothetical protein
LKGNGGYALDNLNSLYTTIFSTICDPRKGMKGVFGGVLRVWGIGDAFDCAICVLPEAEKRHNVLIIDTAILLGIRGDLG